MLKGLWWRHYAKRYDGMWDTAWTCYLADCVIAVLNKRNVKRVLELGCGTGLITRVMIDAGFQVIGVDNCREMLAVARKRCPESMLLEVDVAEIDLKTIPECDALVSLNMIHVCKSVDNAMNRIFGKLIIDQAVGILTWPTDSLTLVDLFRLELRHGRPIGKSLKAGLQRWLFGLIGVPLGIRSNRYGAIMNAFYKNAANSIVVCEEKTIENCQHFVVFASG
jgi:SAM-dependent methyltransferase